MLKDEADKLVMRHQSLVRKIASRMVPHVKHPWGKDDLILAGNLGLVQASQRYTPRSDASFTTFASKRIWGAMWDFIRDSRLNKNAPDAGVRMEQLGRTPAHGEAISRTESTDYLDIGQGLSETEKRMIQLVVHENNDKVYAAREMGMLPGIFRYRWAQMASRIRDRYSYSEN